jgi:hypothetical protein
MVGITNALNLAQKGIYKELQMIPAGGYWEESFWVTTKGIDSHSLAAASRVGPVPLSVGQTYKGRKTS